MALMFFPRGGSSQVMRYLARFLPKAGWDVTLVTGSLGPEGAESNAKTFFTGIDDLHVVDYSAGAPMHASYEDREAAPVSIEEMICIFAKPPVAGQVKTRLGAAIGADAAARLARAFVEDTIESVQTLPWAQAAIRT